MRVCLALLTFFIIIFSTVQEQCEVIRGYLNSTETGSFQLIDTLQNNSLNKYTSYVEFTPRNPLQLSASLLFIENYYNAQQLYFKLSATTYMEDRKKFTINFRISSYASWTKAHIHYLATASDILAAGVFSALNGQIQYVGAAQEQGLERLKISNGVTLSNKLANQETLIPYVFISGIRSQNTALSLRIAFNPDFASGYLTVIMDITEGEIDYLEVLDFTYLVISVHNNLRLKSVLTVGEQVSESLKCELNKNQQFQGNYFGLGGLDAEALSSLLVQKRRLLVIENLDNLQIFMKAFQVKGLTLSFQPDITCPSNFVRNVDIEGNQVCMAKNNVEEEVLGTLSQKCGSYQRYNNSTSECQCIQGYLRLFNTTEQSQEEKENSMSRSNNIICLKICSDFQEYNEILQQCQCMTQNYTRDGTCIGCSDPFEAWIVQTKSCQCVENASIVKGKCRICSQHSEMTENGQCQCKDGYTGNGLICRKSRNILASAFNYNLNFTIVFPENFSL